MSRHKACKLCRDRKVRCDGGQPSCGKCVRLNEVCVYSSTYKPTKADLAQTIESLRDRVETAEARMARQNSLGQISDDRVSPNQDLAMDVGSVDFSQFNMQFPFISSPTNPFTPSTHGSGQRQPVVHFPDISDSDFFNSIPLTVETPDDQPESPSQRHSGDRDVFLPSLREIRALNSASSSSSSSQLSSLKLDKNEQTENMNRILAEFQAFSSSIFFTQAEITVISSAVAEYLAWMRKVPGMPSSPNCAATLETLETRIRELQDMAENRHWAAWRQMAEKLDGLNVQLNIFGSEMQKRAAEALQHLHTSYDVGKAMQEQRPALLQHE